MERYTRYLSILGIQLRASIAVGMQYRFDFVLEGFLSLLWIVVTLTPLMVVFHLRPSVAGWSYPEAMVVVGWFTILKSILEGAINPSLMAVIEHVRKGTLDFILIKPADAQFLVSTGRFDPWRAFDTVSGLLIFGYAFHALGRLPAPSHVMASLLMLLTATAVLYSMWIAVVSVAFFAVRVDNLGHLFGSIFDAARWPISVFRGAVRFLFTFVFPLALMTTVPAQALLGQLSISTGLAALAGGVAFAVVARAIWNASTAHYTSASS